MKNEDAENWFDEGREFHKSGNLEEAIRYYSKAVSLKSDYAEAFNNWGNALSDLAKSKQEESLFHEAFKKYDSAINFKSDYTEAFNNWGNALSDLAEIKQDKSLFHEAFKKYSEAIGTTMYNAFVYYNWGTALYHLADYEWNESLFEDAARKFNEAAKGSQNDEDIFNNWGNVLSDLAKIRKDESLFKEAIDKYNIAIQLNPNDADVFCNLGETIFDLAKIKKNKSLCKESAKYFKKSKKDILDILVNLSEDNEDIIKTEILYPILEDSNTNDGRFFQEVTGCLLDKTKINEYKEVYIRSILIISQLHISNKNEKSVAHYREKTISQEMLFNDSKIRLNAVNYSNDPTEGEILLKYLFGEKHPSRESLNIGYGAFAGCFTFNYNSLNQFRLYGKEKEKEGTGLSLVFRNSFFNKEAKMAMKRLNPENSDSLRGKKEYEKYALFRCIYIDPITQQVETIGVGQKEKYLFFREEKDKKSDEDIKKDYNEYIKEINKIIDKIKKNMEGLRKLIRELDHTIVGQLLINLRYLTKHIAFKEEQECRIIRICHLYDPDDKIVIKIGDGYKQIYIEYEPKVSDHIEKIYFGPKATEMELFQDILKHKNIRIFCEKSTNPLA
ncbi:MAG: tetratricopeptide repeat protein [Fibromonadaceae bacterium]|jgi:tetratricopeptide (TPR) repeat protein|nr:tetratricopeptide repeat protein [Fibromonadaceae bacterium]